MPALQGTPVGCRLFSWGGSGDAGDAAVRHFGDARVQGRILCCHCPCAMSRQMELNPRRHLSARLPQAGRLEDLAALAEECPA